MDLQVFDPAMCCSTGVCGPRVDAALAQFASDLEWLRSTGSTVTRVNLGQEPGAFVSAPAVAALLQASGEAALPVILIAGEVKSFGRYPSRAELADWTGTRLSADAPQPEPVMSSTAQPGCGPHASSGCC